MRKGLFVLVVLGTVFASVPVFAQTDTIEIFIEGTARFPPRERVVATETVPSNLVGATCSGIAVTSNNASEHPDNDFIVASGGTSGEILDWESTAGATIPMAGTVTLGAEITVTLRLGSDDISSGGVLIVLSCSQPEPPTTTTTQPPPDPTTTTTTTAPPPGATTTTEPPPTGGVAAGGGGTAGGSPAAPWVGGGALLLAAALGAVALGRQLVTKRN